MEVYQKGQVNEILKNSIVFNPKMRNPEKNARNLQTNNGKREKYGGKIHNNTGGKICINTIEMIKNEIIIYFFDCLFWAVHS